MKSEIIIHHLTELEKHMKKVEVTFYASLGFVDSYSPTNNEAYEITKIEVESFEQRLRNLMLQLNSEETNNS